MKAETKKENGAFHLFQEMKKIDNKVKVCFLAASERMKNSLH
ncbi:MAG TPA: hypothetical protein VK553_08270 [Candidatus Nitrosopolaris rasttigaisensis]|jgi:hypothetical protein|nr:hypothetical protein [Candidatus Nitrosopolaris rasttigaisensis]